MRVACAATASGRVLAALVAVLVLEVARPRAKGLAVLAVRRGTAGTQAAGAGRTRPPAVRDRGVVARLESVRGAAAGEVAATVAAVPAKETKGLAGRTQGSSMGGWAMGGWGNEVLAEFESHEALAN